MTKDEIIEHHCNVFDLIDKGQLHHVESAMDQWAKQQAIAFANWEMLVDPDIRAANEDDYIKFLEQQSQTP